MKLALTRHASVAGATIGTLSIDGVPQCFTLEDVVREVPGMPVESWKLPGVTAIPRGTYGVVITPSPHFGRDMPLLVDVPGYEGIRIHFGNTAKDTDGCILVGYTDADAFVGRSRDAFLDLFRIIDDALAHGETVTITIA